MYNHFRSSNTEIILNSKIFARFWSRFHGETILVEGVDFDNNISNLFSCGTPPTIAITSKSQHCALRLIILEHTRRSISSSEYENTIPIGLEICLDVCSSSNNDIEINDLFFIWSREPSAIWLPRSFLFHSKQHTSPKKDKQSAN